MVQFVLLMCLIIDLAGCRKGHEKAPVAQAASEKAELLRSVREEALRRAYEIRDPATGWLDRQGCDAMIWTGKAAAAGLEKVAVLAAEYPEAPGKFGRRPAPRCWTPEGGDQGSKTEWSKDMAIGGLLPWAWRAKDRAALERHAQYGKAHDWKMGEPLADGRTIYTPSLIGLLYQTIFSLGGEDNLSRKVPSFYPPGLTDFEAHLQMMEIWLRAEMAAAHGDADAIPAPAYLPDGASEGTLALTVSQTMWERIKEHRTREPACPFYQAMAGTYDGNMDPALDLLLASKAPACSYVRCGDDAEQCQLAEWLFVSDLVLRRFPHP